MRQVLIKLVAKFNPPNAAQVIPPYLSSRRDRSSTEQSLKKFGTAAEEPTMKHLDGPDCWVRSSAIAVLAVVGTEKSIERLEKIASDEKDPSLQYSARRAIQSIKSRSN